jgi:hypothetical protein
VARYHFLTWFFTSVVDMVWAVLGCSSGFNNCHWHFAELLEAANAACWRPAHGRPYGKPLVFAFIEYP